ncbi:MAG: AgmX/PglI C-terminal domain-containing protein [Kofleriaceae bacterium]|jgi:hypothetical protein|nr:AgmX/PglI C-terminal domain-containing protein [Kofleriaceae bacterium]MBP9203231.1 AgmX/PglI C-terminal domain-containing protein [Kofleriaceae bacterium]
MSKVPLIFRLYKGDQFLREEKLTLPVIKIGKLSSSHLRLDDESVSRMHAIIEVGSPSDISIIDLGSTKGTFVNGQKVNKAKLQAGDLVLVGDTRIEVQLGAAEEDDEIPTRVNEAAIARPASASVPPMDLPAPSAPAPAAPAYAAPAAPAYAAPAAPAYAAPAAPAYAAPAYSAPAAPPPAVRPPPGMPSPFATATAAPAGFQQYAAESVDDASGARAVEVAAMLGDSVVSVRHVMNPRAGKVSTATYALFIGGAVALLGAVISFALAVNNAKYNNAKKEYWVHVQKRPEHAFRERMLPMSRDWVTFGGFLIGLGCLAMGLLRYREERQSPFFRVGTAPDVEFPLGDMPMGSFPLVAPIGDDFVFNFTQGMDGDLVVDGQSTSLADLAAQGRARPSSTAPGGMEVPIPAKARIRVRAGKATFLINSVNKPRRQAVPLFAMAQSSVMAYFAGSAAVHLGLWALLRTVSPDPDAANLDLAALEDVSTDSSSTSQDDPPPPPPEETEEDGEDESGGTGTAMTLEEGLMGKKDSTAKEGQYKMQKTQDQEQLARIQAVEAARTAGILGSTALQQGGAFASLTGTGDVSSGFDDANVYGGLLGNEAGEMYGGFGFGRSGFGPGGGGTGWGTIGTGRYGTIGHGSGTGSGYGVGGGRGGMRGRSSSVPQVRIGQPTAVGDLDKAIIRRYIKRNEQKIAYCYEKQLIAKPGLQGTVTTQFFITPNGNVASSTASGVDGEVSSCVAGVIKNIEFPKPKGGGGVQVNYPFNFRPTGG